MPTRRSSDYKTAARFKIKKIFLEKEKTCRLVWNYDPYQNLREEFFDEILDRFIPLNDHEKYE